jgi:mRNA interferase MazF
MTTFKKGDIVLTDFIFSNGKGKKRRPAVIVSKDIFNKQREDVIIAAITSNITRTLVGDTKMKNWKEAGLLKPSVITGILQTIEKKLVIKKIGHLCAIDLDSLIENINKIL